MIRVLHVVTIMNRNGLENRIMDIYRRVDKSKVQFDFLTHRKERGEFDDEIETLGGQIYRINPIRVTAFFKYLKELDAFFKEHSYKIVHSHVNTFSTWVLFAAKRHNVPIRIAHSRTWGAEKGWKSIFKYFSRLFINIPATHKFGCSKQAGQWLFGKKGIEKPNKFEVVTNSFEIGKFAFKPDVRNEYRRQLGITEEEIALVHVGRFTQQKNHTKVIEVFKEIYKRNNRAKLFLIGSGDKEGEIDNLLGILGLTDVVTKIGQVPNVGDYLNAMDGFIFPSLFEGFGTVTVESQCNGLPILASDTIPTETKVTKWQEFESLDSSAEIWADHLLKMLETLPREDGSAAVKKAGFDIDDTYKKMENFYLLCVQEVEKSQ